MSGETPRLTAAMASRIRWTPMIWACLNPDEREAIAALAAGTHVVVPREPTKEMLAALTCRIYGVNLTSHEVAALNYRAALAAAEGAKP